MTDGDAAKSDLTKQPWKLWHNLGFCFQWQPCNYSIFKHAYFGVFLAQEWIQLQWLDTPLRMELIYHQLIQ